MSHYHSAVPTCAELPAGLLPFSQRISSSTGNTAVGIPAAKSETSRMRRSKSKSRRSQHRSPPTTPAPPRSPAAVRRSRRVAAIALLVLLPLLAGGTYLLGDWYRGLPVDSQPRYVGRETCATCHVEQSQKWHQSDHDLAMDRATPETVLGDFEDARLEHYGTTSRMHRDGSRYLVDTEGPDGQQHTYEVKYVLGYEPLQQYMVEMNRPADLLPEENSRVQVLRISWDTQKKRWFYLSPPDVDEKLSAGRSAALDGAGPELESHVRRSAIPPTCRRTSTSRRQPITPPFPKSTSVVRPVTGRAVCTSRWLNHGPSSGTAGWDTDCGD